MTSKSTRFGFGEIDCAAPCSTFIVSPAVLIARMGRADLMVTFDPRMHLYFLKSRDTATIVYSVGVSASAVIQSHHDGLISAASGELPLTYLLTSKGRQAAKKIENVRSAARASGALHGREVSKLASR
jgi:hypothetical protein